MPPATSPPLCLHAWTACLSTASRRNPTAGTTTDSRALCNLTNNVLLPIANAAPSSTPRVVEYNAACSPPCLSAFHTSQAFAARRLRRGWPLLAPELPAPHHYGCATRFTPHTVLFLHSYVLHDEGDEERRSALSRTMQSTGAYCRYVTGFAFASRLVPKSINYASHPPMLPHDDHPDGSPLYPLDPRVKHRAPLESTW